MFIPFMYMASVDLECRTGVLIWVLARKRKEESQEGLFVNCLVMLPAKPYSCFVHWFLFHCLKYFHFLLWFQSLHSDSSSQSRLQTPSSSTAKLAPPALGIAVPVNTRERFSSTQVIPTRRVCIHGNHLSINRIMEFTTGSHRFRSHTLHFSLPQSPHTTTCPNRPPSTHINQCPNTPVIPHSNTPLKLSPTNVDPRHTPPLTYPSCPRTDIT